ncbi:hypothetical protein [Pedobacter sp. ASV12]|uniref:hypothetical protein n=1 Tax=Pedobacter sp. ASV12 TaxID=2795120 RepID=UPI0018EDE124|nr:hypothetical protein [Pedobacter sp. ASV12]
MKKLNWILILATLAIVACRNKQVKLQATEVSQSEATATDSSTLIIAGQQIGELHLNQDATEVAKLLGKPNAGDAAMGKAWGIWYDKGDSSIVNYAVYTTYSDSTMRTKSVQQLRTRSPLYKTAAGLGVRSDFSMLHNVYPALQKLDSYRHTKTKDTLTIYDDVQKGIAFELVNNSCVAVIVHPVHKKSNETYLTYDPDWKLIK